MVTGDRDRIMYEITLRDVHDSCFTYIATAFKFNPVMFVAEIVVDTRTMEVKTMFFPYMHYKNMEVLTVAMDHEENHGESDETTSSRNN